MEASRANDLRPGTECLPGGVHRPAAGTESKYADHQEPLPLKVRRPKTPSRCGRCRLTARRWQADPPPKPCGGKVPGPDRVGTDFEESPSEPPRNTGRAAGTRLSCVAPEAGPILRLVGIPEKSIVGPGPRAPATVRGPWSRPNAPNRPAMASLHGQAPGGSHAAPEGRGALVEVGRAASAGGISKAVRRHGCDQPAFGLRHGPRHRHSPRRPTQGPTAPWRPSGESLAPPRPLRRRRPSRSAAGAWQSPTQ